MRSYKLLIWLMLSLAQGAVWAASEAVGVVTLAIGQVSHVQGQSIYVGDQLVTGAGAQMHVHFKDDARIVLRADTQVFIENYEYFDADPAKNRVKYALEKGVMRSITGLAGQQNKSGFRLNTPLAAIGVRGTDFITQVLDNHVKVAVVTGGVSVAPFDQFCAKKDFGPCETAHKLEARANAGVNAVEVIKRGSDIQIQPSDWLPEAMKAVAKANGVGVTAAESGSSQQAAAEQQASNVVTSSSVHYNPIHWGRWDGVLTQDAQSVTAAALINARYQPIAANSSFGLFSAQGLALGELPRTGNIQLKPEQAQVYYRYGNELVTGVFDDGVLGVDFADKAFTTHLYTKASEGAPVDYLYARGSVFNNGGFISHANQSNAQVSGMLTGSGAQAGMLFEQAQGNRVVTGGVWWKP